MKSNKLLAFLIPLFINTCYANKNIEQHLAEGNQYLVTGKYNDAIMSFDAAIRKLVTLKDQTHAKLITSM